MTAFTGAGVRFLHMLLLLASTLLVGNCGALHQSDHLVVLSHGIMGNGNDLLYLSKKLEAQGCVVLRSTANEVLQSLNGIETGGRNLAKEIEDLRASEPNLKRISFVGNSMGGLYARYAIKELFEPLSRKIATLEPHYFMVSELSEGRDSWLQSVISSLRIRNRLACLSPTSYCLSTLLCCAVGSSFCLPMRLLLYTAICYLVSTIRRSTAYDTAYRIPHTTYRIPHTTYRIPHTT
jgi:hypothetical protein